MEIEAREKFAVGKGGVNRAKVGYPTAAALTTG